MQIEVGLAVVAFLFAVFMLGFGAGGLYVSRKW
jgi:hypothetical protein